MSGTRRAVSTAAIAVLALSVAGSGSSAADPVAQKSAPVKVSMRDNFFKPIKATVRAGGKVTWTNNGKATHNATANKGSFNTGNFGPGQSRTVKFRKPGKVPYNCTIHAGMTGKVVVLPPA